VESLVPDPERLLAGSEQSGASEAPHRVEVTALRRTPPWHAD
jgi:hypothetical protein